MFNRFKKAFSALLIVIFITLGCLAFMPWRMNEVVPELADARKCVVFRYDGSSYATAYPKGEALGSLAEVLGNAVGHYDRARADIHYEEDAPLYRVYLWNHEGPMPEIWICGDQFFYNNSQFVLNEGDARQVGIALQACFG